MAPAVIAPVRIHNVGAFRAVQLTPMAARTSVLVAYLRHRSGILFSQLPEAGRTQHVLALSLTLDAELRHRGHRVDELLKLLGFGLHG